MRNRLLRALATLAVASGVSAPAQTSTWTIDPAHSSVNFSVRHMGVSNVHGSLGGVKGTVNFAEKNITGSSVAATIDAGTIATGIDARDKHLRSPDFFDVEKFPAISFRSTSLTRKGGQLLLTGDLTLHGVTRSVTLNLDGPAPPQTGQDGKVRSGFSAEGVLHRSEFNIGTKFASALVGEDVKFSIDVEIDKQ